MIARLRQLLVPNDGSSQCFISPLVLCPHRVLIIWIRILPCSHELNLLVLDRPKPTIIDQDPLVSILSTSTPQAHLHPFNKHTLLTSTLVISSATLLLLLLFHQLHLPNKNHYRNSRAKEICMNELFLGKGGGSGCLDRLRLGELE